MSKSWQKGPNSDVLIEAHDRSILAMATNPKRKQFVTASSDHSLRIYNYDSGSLVRTLYNKSYGHQEWVTTVDYAPDGRIVSGGMDSKICVWEADHLKCQDLFGHRGSISKVQCHQQAPIMISSSYDKSLKVWDINQSQLLHTLKNTKYGHSKAVQTFYWKNSLCVSGGRDSLCCVWDVNSAKLVSTLDEHSAPVTKIDLFPPGSIPSSESVLVTGSMDGFVIPWDLRTSKPIAKVDVTASVSDFAVGNNGIAVGGSDKFVRLIDPKTWKVQLQCKGHKDVICCVKMKDNLIMSGGANGWILVHDGTSGKCLYGVGACENGPCNCIEVLPPKHLIAAGDDGNVIVFHFSQ